MAIDPGWRRLLLKPSTPPTPTTPSTVAAIHPRTPNRGNKTAPEKLRGMASSLDLVSESSAQRTHLRNNPGVAIFREILESSRKISCEVLSLFGASFVGAVGLSLIHI
eukprot:1418165-Rhodomonas_salina.2